MNFWLTWLVAAVYLAIGVAVARLATRKDYDAQTAILLLLLWPISVAYAAWALTRWVLHWLATGELPAEADPNPPTPEEAARDDMALHKVHVHQHTCGAATTSAMGTGVHVHFCRPDHGGCGAVLDAEHHPLPLVAHDAVHGMSGS